jgi:hypothetical protein
VAGKQYSTAGPLAELANIQISNFQGRANDPPAYVPPIVDDAQVFYEHTAATAAGIYNLWGQVPVRSQGPVVHYYDLTPMGTTHSGKTGVALWYRNFIVPTLGNQAPLVHELELSGQIDDSEPMTTGPTTADGHSISVRRPEFPPTNSVYVPVHAVENDRPSFSGLAAPNSTVRLYIGRTAAPTQISLAGWTKATASGNWSLSTSQPLSNGQYRVVVAAFSHDLRTRPGLTVVPTLPLGQLVVESPEVKREPSPVLSTSRSRQTV